MVGKDETVRRRTLFDPEHVSGVVRSCCWRTLENIVKRREHFNVNIETHGSQSKPLE